MAKYDKEGRELPDPNPVEVPLGMKRPPDIHELIARAMRTEAWRQKMASQGLETFEEANDFEVEDDGPEDELALAERAFLMAEEFPKDRAAIEDAARNVQEARRERQKGGGGTPPQG